MKYQRPRNARATRQKMTKKMLRRRFNCAGMINERLFGRIFPANVTVFPAGAQSLQFGNFVVYKEQ
jgi:hypothetical protein